MQYLITPPETHFDRGLGISANNFRAAARILKSDESRIFGTLPLYYLQRHAIELYLKSLIYILHKKFNIPFGDGYDLKKPAFKANEEWKPLSKTHNLTDLFRYFNDIFTSTSVKMPAVFDRALPEKLEKQINLINGYDPNSTYFRYPDATNKVQDQKKSSIQAINEDNNLAEFIEKSEKAVVCSVMIDEKDNIKKIYSLTEDRIPGLKNALDKVVDSLYGLHCMFRAELTNWT